MERTLRACGPRRCAIRRARGAVAHAAAFLALLALAGAVAAASVTVDDTADAPDAAPGDGVCATAGGRCTLRAAIQETNALRGADTIRLPAGTYTLTIAGQDEDRAATGDLDVTDTLTILGAGPAVTIVDGNAIDRIFEVSASLTASGMTLRNGNPGTTNLFKGGGAIYSVGTVSLTRVVVTGNSASIGGGIASDTGSTLTLTDVTVAGNTATFAGGGIDSMNIETLTNVTVSGNTADNGAGIDNEDGTLVLLSSTIVGNDLGGRGDWTIRNSLFASAGSPACTGGGSTIAEDHNLESGDTCGFGDPSDLRNTPPRLGPLEDNGGGIPTHALLPGSAAIDAGSADCPPPTTDARGVARPKDGNGDGAARCDVGAFEFQPDATTTTSNPPSTTTTTLAGDACGPGASFASIECRLRGLRTTMRSRVPAGTLQDALAAILDRTQTSVGRARAFTARRATRSALAKGASLLHRFDKRLASRPAKRAVMPDVAAALKAAADQVRTDVLALRRAS